MIVDSGTLSVVTANDLDAITEGTVTAEIATDSTVDSLVTLTGTNAYTIVISEDDAIGSTASELNSINKATSLAVDASVVTSLALDELSNISELLLAVENTSQFTVDSFSLLEEVNVSDSSLIVTELNDVIELANILTGDTTTTAFL